MCDSPQGYPTLLMGPNGPRSNSLLKLFVCSAVARYECISFLVCALKVKEGGGV